MVVLVISLSHSRDRIMPPTENPWNMRSPHLSSEEVCIDISSLSSLWVSAGTRFLASTLFVGRLAKDRVFKEPQSLWNLLFPLVRFVTGAAQAPLHSTEILTPICKALHSSPDFPGICYRGHQPPSAPPFHPTS